jgi:hypothetical protein
VIGSAGYGLGGDATPGATYAVVGRAAPGVLVPPWRDEAATRCFLLPPSLSACRSMVKEDEETVERTMLLTRLLLLWRRLTMTYLFSPTGLRAAATPCLGGGGLTQGLRARDCGRWLLGLSSRLVSQPLWPNISSLAAPSVWFLFLLPSSLSSLLGDAAA